MKKRVDQLKNGQAFWSPVELILTPTTAMFVSESYIVTQEWNNPSGGFQCSPVIADTTKYLNLIMSPALYGRFLTKAECAQECKKLNTQPPINGKHLSSTLSGSNSSGTVYFDSNAISDTELRFEDTVPHFELKCECGGDVAGTTHTEYCPKYDKEK